ncbi:MAG: SH3 domain-containing protein [Clostridia bacterium]|nr:SH3 domain-containing protein [Clostridia bacterium]
MKRKLFLCILLVLLPALAAAQASVFVDNPNPADRLNLRAAARGDSVTLGKYYNGVEAELIGYTKNGYAHVRIEPLEGYMDIRYLSDAPVVSAQPWLTVRNSGGSGVNIRKEPSTGAKILAFAENGERVTVLAVRRDGFLHVRFGDVYGFASAKLLSPSPDFHKTDTRGIIPTVPPTPSPSPTPSPTPDPTPYMTPDSGRRIVFDPGAAGVHLRKAPQEDADSAIFLINGREVLLLSKENGWAYIDAGGAQGYVPAGALKTP